MMTHASATRLTLVMLGWMLFFRVASTGTVPAARQATDQAPCCLTRLGYEGRCVVQPAAGETCASILEYLNSPNTVGKTYCGGTRLRGGWSLVDCNKASTPGSVAPK